MRHGRTLGSGRALGTRSAIVTTRPAWFHGIDPQQYLDEIMRVLPDWPKARHIELARSTGSSLVANLRPDELDSLICTFTVPPAALNFARLTSPETRPRGDKDGFRVAITNNELGYRSFDVEQNAKDSRAA